jgi:hypothetical protein
MKESMVNLKAYFKSGSQIRYILWPVIVPNTLPVCLFDAVFASAYQRSGDAQNVDLTQPPFWLHVAIFIIN